MNEKINMFLKKDFPIDEKMAVIGEIRGKKLESLLKVMSMNNGAKTTFSIHSNHKEFNKKIKEVYSSDN